MVAENAIVGLVEGANQVGAGVGERETVAMVQPLAGHARDGHAVPRDRLGRHQMSGVDLARRSKNDVAGVPFPAGRRVERPGGVAEGEVEGAGVGPLVGQPLHDLGGVSDLVQRRAQVGGERPFQRRTIEPCGRLRRVRLGRAALHEQALAGIERREAQVAGRRRPQFGLDTEQTGEKAVEMRRQRQQQFRFLLGIQRFGRRAGLA